MTSRERRESVNRRFLNVLGAFLDPSDDHRDRFESIVQETTGLLEVGEEGIAFENLVENLHEFDVAIDGFLLLEIRRLGLELGIDTSVWAPLEANATIVPGSIDDIRIRLVEGCSEEDFAKMTCPVCGSSLTLSVHPNVRTFFVRCAISPMHLGFHEEASAPQEWFVSRVRRTGWY